MSKTLFFGKYRAKVVDVNDPERRGRIRVQCPAVLGNYKSAWCEPCIPYATDFAGDYYVPPINEAIWVEFEEGDPNKPIWNGGWYKTDSTPLLPDSKPEDYRFISFKNSVLRMGDKEFLFEIRNGEKSYVFSIDSSTVMGLNFIGSRSEQELKDLGDLMVNKENLLVNIPNDITDLGKGLNELIDSYNKFIKEAYPNDMTKVYEEFNKVFGVLENLGSDVATIVKKINDEINPNIKDLDTRLKKLESGGA